MVRVRGELVLEVERKGTAEAGAYTVEATVPRFAELATSLEAFLFDPPAVPVEEGFASSVERLDVFDLVVRAWVRWWNLRERDEVLELESVGDLPPTRTVIPPGDGMVY